MLTFEWPWLFILLPVPIIYRLVRSRAEATTPALKVPVYSALSRNVAVLKNGGGWHWLALALLTATWIALLAAAARPTWVGDPIAIPSTGRDLLMAVDISGSKSKGPADLARQSNPDAFVTPSRPATICWTGPPRKS